MISKRVFLGDQSPWGRGILRALVLKMLNIRHEYFIHDLDCPWVGTGNYEIKVTRKNKWPEYSSLKSIRVGSWTPQNESGFEPDEKFKKANPIGGFAYLTGPSGSHETILSFFSKHRQEFSLFKEMIREELEWYGRIGGDTSSLINILDESISPINFAQRIGQVLGIEVNLISDFFKQHQSEILSCVPKDNLWVIDERGRRYERNPGEDCPGPKEAHYYAPKGKFLPLLIERLGFAVGATNLPYAHHEIKIEISWYEAPLQFRDFWFSYPTALSFLALGGKIAGRVNGREVILSA